MTNSTTMLTTAEIAAMIVTARFSDIRAILKLHRIRLPVLPAGGDALTARLEVGQAASARVLRVIRTPAPVQRVTAV
jgi:hypothetical protein